MKSLKEALLNRSKSIDVANVAMEMIERYINTNYTTRGKLTFEPANGIYIVSCEGGVEVKNKNIEKLTDGFVWGEVKRDFRCAYCKNLISLEGAPKRVGENFSCYNCTNLES